MSLRSQRWALLFFMAAGCAAQEEAIDGADAAIERSRGSMSDAELKDYRISFQTEYLARLDAAKKVAAAEVPTCTDAPALLARVDALIAVNRGAEGVELAARCIASTRVADRKIEHLLAAMRAERYAYDFRAALRHAGEAANLARGKVAQAVALERADLVAAAHDFAIEQKIDQTIEAGRFTPAATRDLVADVAGEAATAHSFEITAAREKDYLRAVDDADDPAVIAWLLQNFARATITTESRFHDALNVLASERGKTLVKNLPAPYLFQTALLVHRAIMNHGNAFGRDQGKQLLAATAPHQRKDQLLFMPAMMPFDYDELRASACKDAFAKGSGKSTLATAQKGYLDGSLTPTQALDAIAPLRKDALVDVEVFAGTMFEAKGDDDEALDAYWAARQACPWYGRATSGTYGIQLRRASAAKADAFRAEPPGRPPEAIRQYVSNFDVLSPAQRKATEFGLGFWWPYLDSFVQTKRSLYIQPTFQRLSETGFAIPGVDLATHRGEDDGRLTDDLDGIGGERIVVAFSRLTDYKGGTIVHEAAHQFHLAAPQPVQACIKELFGAAKKRDTFCLGYAATNELEYFAVGVQHFASPDGFVGFGGITKDWYAKNDPKLLTLIASVEAARGDMGKITCPR